MTEMLDIYDDNLEHIGVKSRADVHRDGDWHKVFHCWVIYRDDAGQDWVIIQKRAPSKKSFPNMLDVSAAGHYAAGETPREGMRELQEELGLSPRYEELIHIGTRITFSRYGGAKDREVADVYLYVCNQPLHDYCYQKEEITGLIALNVQQGLKLFAGEINTISVPCCGFDSKSLTITKEHFIDVPDHYWEKIFMLTTRCLNGENNLWI
ncbi:MAG: NUDIX domain-containing protein [Chloroflexota bacterium]